MAELMDLVDENDNVIGKQLEMKYITQECGAKFVPWTRETLKWYFGLPNPSQLQQLVLA